MNKKRFELLGSAPVGRAILRLAMPTMLAAVVQILYNITDTIFIGMLGDTDLVAAISIILPLVFAIIAFGNIFGIGASSYISRQLGAGNLEEARHANAVAAYTAAAVGILLTVVFVVFRGPLLSVIGTSADTLGPTSDYFTILSSFSPLLILQIALAGLVRSEGATSKAMWGMIIGLGTNIVLDPVFILALGMGIAGAAWATVIGNVLGVMFYVLHFAVGKTVLSIHLKDFRPSRRIFGEIFKIGIPASLSMLVMSISFLLVNVVAATYGDEVVAGIGICQRVMNICIMLMVGIAQGYQPFAGFNYGARQYDRLKRGLKMTMLFNISLGVIFMVLFVTFSHEISGIFIQGEPETVNAAAIFLSAFALALPLVGLQFTLMTTFQAVGKALQAMFISLGRQAIVFIPMLFIFNNAFGLDGLRYSQPSADMISSVAAALMSISFVRQMRTLHDEQQAAAAVPGPEIGLPVEEME